MADSDELRVIDGDTEIVIEGGRRILTRAELAELAKRDIIHSPRVVPGEEGRHVERLHFDPQRLSYLLQEGRLPEGPEDDEETADTGADAESDEAEDAGTDEPSDATADDAA
ncbi:MAG: hypothetical protein ABEI39_03960 [Halobacteriales archaeon]